MVQEIGVGVLTSTDDAATDGAYAIGMVPGAVPATRDEDSAPGGDGADDGAAEEFDDGRER